MNPYDSIVPDAPESQPVASAPNPYADIVAQGVDSAASTVKTNLYQAQGVNPDEYAKAKAIGDQAGLHPDTVMPQLKDMQGQQETVARQQTASQSTPLQDFLLNDINAKLAQDDLDQLGLIGKITQTFSAGYNRAELQGQLTDIYTREAFGRAQPQDAANAESLRRQIADVPNYSGFLGFAGKNIGGLLPMVQTANKAGLASAAAGSIVPGVGTAAGYATGFGLTFTEEFARQTFADMYHNLGEVKDSNGNPISEPLRMTGAIIGGVVTAAAAEFGQAWMTDSIATGASKLFTDAFTEVATRPTIGRAMGNLALGLAKSGLEGAAFNTMIMLGQTVGEQTARLFTPDMQTIFTDPAQWSQFKTSLASSIEDGISLFMLLHAPGAVMGFVGDGLRVKQANMDAASLTDLGSAISESKTRNRAVDVFIDFLRSQTKDSPVESFQIPADTLMSLYQSTGVDPFKLPLDKDPLLGWLPDRDQQLREALATKGDVIIPSADFLGRLAGTPAFEKLLPDIRVRPDAFTMREANDPVIQAERFRHMVNLAAEFKQSYEQDLASHEPIQKVFNDVYQQSLEAGIPANEASQYGVLLGNHYATRAERSAGAYADAFDAYQKSQLKIQQGEMSGGLHQAQIFDIKSRMSKDTGKGDITTGQTPQPEGGESWRNTSKWDIPAFTPKGSIPDPLADLFELPEETPEENVANQERSFVDQRMANYKPPIKDKFFRTENINEISSALLASKEGKIGYHELKKIVYENLPLPPEEEHGSGVIGDIPTGSVFDSILQALGFYLDKKLQSVDPSPPHAPQFRGTRSLEEMPPVEKDPYGGYLVKFSPHYSRTGFKSIEEAREWWKKENDGSPVMMGAAPEPTSPYYRTFPETWDKLIEAFRENPAKLLRDTLEQIKIRVSEDEEGLHLLVDYYGKGGEFDPEEIARKHTEEVNARRKSIHVVKKEEPPSFNPSSSPSGGELLQSSPDFSNIPDEPIPAEQIKDYSDLAREASRRAFDAAAKEQGKAVRLSEKQLRAQGEALYNELPSSQAIATMRRAGMNIKSLADWDKDTVKELVRKYPGLISKKGRFAPDEIASMHGYEGDDALIQDLAGAQSKSEFLDKYVKDARESMGAEMGLSSERWQELLSQKEKEVFAELTRSAPTARLEAIQKRMKDKGPRAALVLPPGGYGTGPHLLNLFAARDRSSFLHEGSHLFLEELVHDALLPTAPDQVKADLQTVKNWFSEHADTANGQILAARKKAEAELKAHPDDPQAQAKADAFEKADALIAEDPEYMKKFAQTLGADIEEPAVRMALMTPFHELFARHGEAYFLEGKAPAPGLQSVFDSFKTWIKRIYEKVAGKGRAMLGLSSAAGTDIKVSSEVRGVMDRIIATDDQIALVRQQQRLGRMFKTAQEGGMTAAEFEMYNSLVSKAESEAKAKVQTRAMADLEKQKSDAWKAKDAEMRPEVEAQVNARPDLQALTYLRSGKELGAEATGEPRTPIRLDRDALVRLVGEKGLKDLPQQIYRIEGGEDPQQIAEMFGMRSGTELARALLDLEAQRRALRVKGINTDLRQHLINETVNSRLSEHFGDIMQDGSMPQAAMDAVHTDASTQALAVELRALMKMGGSERARYGPTYDAIGWAKGVIGSRKVGDVLNLNRYARDEAKAGQAVQTALLRGETQRAIEAKKAQIANHALYNEAKKAQEAVAQLTKQATRYGKKKTINGMDQEALNQVHTLLERFGLKTADPNATGRMVLSAWVDKMADDGVDVNVPDSLYDPGLPGAFKDMTIDQARDLATAVKSIAYVGREAGKITLAGKKMALDTACDELASGAYKNIDLNTLPRERNPGAVQGNMGQRTAARWRNAKGMLSGMGSSLLKIESIVDDLDAGNSRGPYNKYLFREAANAEGYKGRKMAEMTAMFKDLKKLYPDKEWKKLGQMLPEIPELTDNRTGEPLLISHGELVSMALNWGNEGNIAKMLKGEGWRQEAVERVFERHMTKADWDYVQGVWNMFETLRPEISAREKRMTGIEPTWVQALPVETPFGTYRGGYYPMAYDPLRSGDVMERLISKSEKLLDSSKSGRPTTDKGYTIERKAGYAAPLLFSLDVIPRHIESVVTDLAYREWLYNTVRLLKDNRVRSAMESTVGRDQYLEMIPWLRRTVSDRSYDPKNMGGWDKFLHGVRTHVTMVGLGFRATTMLMHGTGAALNSIGEVGAPWMAKGVGKFFGTPEKMAEAYRFVTDRSSEMKFRMDNVDRDVRDGLRDLLDQNGFVSGAKRFAYYGIGMLDMASALPTWIAGYEKALAPEAKGGLNMTEADAIYFADKTVRNAHGGGGAKDMAKIQDGSEAFKLLTMFYSFWNHNYQRQRAIVKAGGRAIGDIADGNVMQGTKDFAHVLAKSFFYFVAPMIIHGMFKGGPAEDEDLTYWTMKEVGLGVFSGIPVARDIANMANTGRGYQLSPIVSAINAAQSTKKDIENLATGDKEVSAKWLKHSLNTVGYTFGLPLGQPGQTAQYIWDVMDGNESSEDTGDFLKGLVFGSKQQKH